MIVVSLSALLATPAFNVIVFGHKERDSAPFFDGFCFIELSQNIIFLQ
jgi:hypothetical protein